MKLLSKKQVKEIVGYSLAHIDRMENPKSPYYDPFFPKRLRVGNRKVAWIEQELYDWLRRLIDRRSKALRYFKWVV
jgi:prophage regulatory protein